MSWIHPVLLAATLPLATVAIGGPSAEISLRSCLRGGALRFSPDFSALATISRKTTVDGVVPGFGCLILKGSEPETSVNVNAGTTQYQGHYVWTTNRVVSGFGTYSAAGTSRTFGWLLRNDTGGELLLESLSVVYGQWGARNTAPDGLAFYWKIAPGTIGLADADGWQALSENAFEAPYRAGDAFAVFPSFEPRALRTADRLPAGSLLALKFVDTCPKTGYNAHLGITALSLTARRSEPRGFVFTVR